MIAYVATLYICSTYSSNIPLYKVLTQFLRFGNVNSLNIFHFKPFSKCHQIIYSNFINIFIMVDLITFGFKMSVHTKSSQTYLNFRIFSNTLFSTLLCCVVLYYLNKNKKPFFIIIHTQYSTYSILLAPRNKFTTKQYNTARMCHIVFSPKKKRKKRVRLCFQHKELLFWTFYREHI